MSQSPVQLSVEVQHQLDELVQRGVEAIQAATAAMSRELRETHLPAEAPVGDTGALRTDWQETERDPLTRVVHSGDQAWYAHIVAGGRRAVRPTRRRALTVNGAPRMFAAGTSGDPFHERAMAALEGRTDELIETALSQVGVV